MRFKCRPATIDFLESAPIQLTYRIVVNTSAEAAFDALQNPQTWPKWFPGMTKASDVVDVPEGLTRTVTLNYTLRFKEDFILWEPPSRIAYRVAAVSIPYADALVEDFVVAPHAGGVEIIYRIGLEVHHSLRLVSGLVSKIGQHSYQQALKNLKHYLEDTSH